MDLTADQLLGAPEVRKLAGVVNDDTLRRWQADPEVLFPHAEYVIKKRKYWKSSTVSAWLDRMAVHHAD